MLVGMLGILAKCRCFNRNNNNNNNKLLCTAAVRLNACLVAVRGTHNALGGHDAATVMAVASTASVAAAVAADFPWEHDGGAVAVVDVSIATGRRDVPQPFIHRYPCSPRTYTKGFAFRAR